MLDSVSKPLGEWITARATGAAVRLDAVYQHFERKELNMRCNMGSFPPTRTLHKDIDWILLIYILLGEHRRRSDSETVGEANLRTT